ncbi:hypothetical protein T484DRAFT_1960520 [Baffinella frigidus]|nr:hypothetical protein T484DRAFT_1960520 [Cryptophyta sp. CCMP2293]
MFEDGFGEFDLLLDLVSRVSSIPRVVLDNEDRLVLDHLRSQQRRYDPGVRVSGGVDENQVGGAGREACQKPAQHAEFHLLSSLGVEGMVEASRGKHRALRAIQIVENVRLEDIAGEDQLLHDRYLRDAAPQVARLGPRLLHRLITCDCPPPPAGFAVPVECLDQLSRGPCSVRTSHLHDAERLGALRNPGECLVDEHVECRPPGHVHPDLWAVPRILLLLRVPARRPRSCRTGSIARCVAERLGGVTRAERVGEGVELRALFAQATIL